MTNALDKNTKRMADIGSMTHAILHDLNNSLASIMGFASFLADDLDSTSEQYVFAENIKKAGTQIENLVEQIRAFSMELGTNKDVILNLEDEIKGLVEAMKHNLLQNQQIIFISDIKGAFLKMPIFQFKVMINNLIKNAVQSLGENSGTVMIHMSSTDNEDEHDLKGDYDLISYLHSPHQPKDIKKPQVRIDIIDTGCGMDEVTLNLAPSHHFSTKSADIAHGLGLTISSHIIHYLNGSISIATTPDIGTRVTIVLPVQNVTL